MHLVAYLCSLIVVMQVIWRASLLMKAYHILVHSYTLPHTTMIYTCAQELGMVGDPTDPTIPAFELETPVLSSHYICLTIKDLQSNRGSSISLTNEFTTVYHACFPYNNKISEQTSGRSHLLGTPNGAEMWKRKYVLVL
jgi:hypothetical protein